LMAVQKKYQKAVDIMNIYNDEQKEYNPKILIKYLMYLMK